MSVSFAFMKKVLESAHPSFSSFDTTMNSELKKKFKIIQKKYGGEEQQMFSVLAKFH